MIWTTYFIVGGVLSLPAMFLSARSMWEEDMGDDIIAGVLQMILVGAIAVFGWGFILAIAIAVLPFVGIWHLAKPGRVKLPKKYNRSEEVES